MQWKIEVRIRSHLVEKIRRHWGGNGLPTDEIIQLTEQTGPASEIYGAIEYILDLIKPSRGWDSIKVEATSSEVINNINTGNIVRLILERGANRYYREEWTSLVKNEFGRTREILLHRPTGPAMIYRTDGRVSTSWYIAGKKVGSFESILRDTEENSESWKRYLGKNIEHIPVILELEKCGIIKIDPAIKENLMVGLLV